MITENLFSTPKTARYYLLGKPDKNVKTIWYLLHGYGQLAKDFISEFENILSEKILLVAPEALSKFYFRGLSGNIGASWMTKEDRENEIHDYVNYLNQVFEKLNEKLNYSDLELNILGFSQGCHTAVRWLDRTKLNVNKLILWSGSFPDDVDYFESKEYWKNIDIKTILGNSDRLVNQSIISEQHEKLLKCDIKVELINFDGGHKIDQKLLKKLLK